MYDFIPEIGIIETRNIIKEINDAFGYDLTDFSLTSFKQRIEKFIYKYKLRNPEFFINRIKEDKDFFELFLLEIFVPSTEMFRDPSLWRYLRDAIFKTQIPKTENYNIWLPFNKSGDELFTLCIVLDELRLLDKVTIYAGNYTQKTIDCIKSGYMNPKKLEVSEQNYERFEGLTSLKEYYSNKDNIPYRDDRLIKNINFIKQNINFENLPTKINMVLFRNHMIYFNQTLKEKVLTAINNSIVTGGYLVIGTKENMLGSGIEKNYVLDTLTESIYRKKY